MLLIYGHSLQLCHVASLNKSGSLLMSPQQIKCPVCYVLAQNASGHFSVWSSLLLRCVLQYSSKALCGVQEQHINYMSSCKLHLVISGRSFLCICVTSVLLWLRYCLSWKEITILNVYGSLQIWLSFNNNIVQCPYQKRHYGPFLIFPSSIFFIATWFYLETWSNAGIGNAFSLDLTKCLLLLIH